MRTVLCSGPDCRRPIVWAKTADGKSVPLDPRPPVYRVIDGIMVEPTAELLTRASLAGFGDAGNQVDYMVLHYATCPNASNFTKRAPERESNCARCGWPGGGEATCRLCAGDVRSQCCGAAPRVDSPGAWACSKCSSAAPFAWRFRTRDESVLSPVFASPQERAL